jgi:hypothetical protein
MRKCEIDQRTDVVNRYTVARGYSRKFKAFDKMPPSVAMELMTGWPNIRSRDRQNGSPTAGHLIRLAAKYHGTVGGYMISRRPDARIAITIMTLPVGHEVATKLYKNVKPDNFDLRRGKYVFWWD